MQENVKKALAQKSTVERMSTEELLGHAQRKAAQKTLTPESEEKLVQTVRGQVAAWQEKTKSTLSAMSNDQVWKECMKAAKHPKYPEFAKHAASDSTEDHLPDEMSMRRDVGAWMVWLRTYESTDDDVRLYCDLFGYQFPPIKWSEESEVPIEEQETIALDTGMVPPKTPDRMVTKKDKTPGDAASSPKITENKVTEKAETPDASSSPKIEDKVTEKDKTPDASSSPKIEDKVTEKDKTPDASSSPKIEDKVTEKDKTPDASSSPKIEDKVTEKAETPDASSSPKIEDKVTEKDKTPDASSSPKIEDKVAKKAETPGDGKTSPDFPEGNDDPAKREEEKLKKKSPSMLSTCASTGASSNAPWLLYFKFIAIIPSMPHGFETV